MQRQLRHLPRLRPPAPRDQLEGKVPPSSRSPARSETKLPVGNQDEPPRADRGGQPRMKATIIGGMGGERFQVRMATLAGLEEVGGTRAKTRGANPAPERSSCRSDNSPRLGDWLGLMSDLSQTAGGHHGAGKAAVEIWLTSTPLDSGLAEDHCGCGGRCS